MFAVPITNLDPIYYYSGQIGACQAGMVASINPPCNDSDSFVDYQSAAKLVTSVGPLPSAVTGGYLVTDNYMYPLSLPMTSPLPSAASPRVSVCTVCPGGSNTDQILCSNVPIPTGLSSATVTKPGVSSSSRSSFSTIPSATVTKPRVASSSVSSFSTIPSTTVTKPSITSSSGSNFSTNSTTPSLQPFQTSGALKAHNRGVTSTLLLGIFIFLAWS